MSVIRQYGHQMDMPEKPMQEGVHLTVADVPGVWYKPGTVVTVLADCRQGGVLVSDGRDEELCAWEEFEKED